jgi:hypothetical protein
VCAAAEDQQKKATKPARSSATKDAQRLAVST